MIGEWEENDVQTPWCCDCDNNFSLLLLNKQARCTPLKPEWQNYGFILLALFGAGWAGMPACFKLSSKRWQGSSTDLALRVPICTLLGKRSDRKTPLCSFWGFNFFGWCPNHFDCKDTVNMPSSWRHDWSAMAFIVLSTSALCDIGCLWGVNRKIWPRLMEVDFGIWPLEKQCCND